MRRLVLIWLLAAVVVADEPYRPPPEGFADPAMAKLYRGELVFVDHVNRRGSIRLNVDGHYHEGRLHHFAMLPYGIVRYRGAPAELRDLPIGTVVYGRFYLPPDPQAAVVPIIKPKSKDPTAPPENHAVLLEDDPSLCLRHDNAWALTKVTVKGASGTLTAKLQRPASGEGLDGEHAFTIDGSTRFWRGREVLSLSDLIVDGTLPKSGDKAFNGQQVQLSLSWHPRYLYQKFHLTDVWLDEVAMTAASERQRQVHRHHVRTRWLPARIEAVEHGKFGKAVVTALLLGGMDAELYADFTANSGAKMAAAEATLRTWWPDHDGMDGRITAIDKTEDPPLGSSGIRIRFEVQLVLEGFRPGRFVRIRPHKWPNVKPPVEERIRSLKDRWPGTEVFE